MANIKVIDIDPGLIGTGVAIANLDDVRRTVEFSYEYLERETSFDSLPHSIFDGVSDIFIEDFKVRNYTRSSKMINLVTEFCKDIEYKTGIKPVRLSNAGITKVITDDLLKLLDLYKEPEKTHHKDIREARRQLLLGLSKNKQYNYILAKEIERRLDV